MTSSHDYFLASAAALLYPNYAVPPALLLSGGIVGPGELISLSEQPALRR